MFTQSATDLAVVAVDVTVHSPRCSLNVASATIVVDKGVVVASSVIVDFGDVVVDGGGDVGFFVATSGVDGGGVAGHMMGSYNGWSTPLSQCNLHSVIS